MAPEYALHGIFSAKSDVYSYGVLVLEIVAGRRNTFSQFPGTNHEDLLTTVTFVLVPCYHKQALKLPMHVGVKNLGHGGSIL
jgi:hypothetical protein